MSQPDPRPDPKKTRTRLAGPDQGGAAPAMAGARNETRPALRRR